MPKIPATKQRPRLPLRLGLLPLLLFSGFCSCIGQEKGSRPARYDVLRSHDLGIEVNTRAGQFGGLRIEDFAQRKIVEVPEAFVIVFKDKSVLRSTEMVMTPTSPTLASAGTYDPAAPHEPDHTITRSCWSLTMPKVSARFTWCTIVRKNTEYLRESLAITAQNQDLPMTEVRLLDFFDPAARVDGFVKGSPVVSGNMFYGFEHPLSTSSVENGRVRAALHRDLPLRAGQTVSYSAVLGASQPGQLRRAFLTYLENERPRRYKPFLHYNTWFDLGYTNRFDEAGALDRIHAFGTELTEKRHVQLDSFLFDDGWDDPNTLWGFNSGFPDGFSTVAKAAAEYHAGIGVWLSPWGGYDKQKLERIAFGKLHGYEIENGGYALSGPRYYQQFQKICLEMVDRYHVNQFKFDGTGNAGKVFPGSSFDSDFDAAIHLIERLRQEKPGIFINLTTGTTPSPFWLFYADSIWRGGEDHDFAGVGSARQRWITYRDAQTYRNIVLAGPLFPLNSLMLHGIIYAKQAKDLMSDPDNDFADEVHSYFGSGTQLQELYITPSLLSSTNWDTLASAARWSRDHADTLKDVHWIGGDPNLLQVYGWAAWSPREGILTLRNPSSRPLAFDVEVSKVFELPQGAPTSYQLHTVWNQSGNGRGDMRISGRKLLRVALAPFEVVTFEATPAS